MNWKVANAANHPTRKARSTRMSVNFKNLSFRKFPRRSEDSRRPMRKKLFGGQSTNRNLILDQGGGVSFAKNNFECILYEVHITWKFLLFFFGGGERDVGWGTRVGKVEGSRGAQGKRERFLLCLFSFNFYPYFF